MECDKKCFTVTWRIENYDFCLQSPGLESPSFFIDSVQTTSWKFRLEPKLQNEQQHILLFCKKNALSDTIAGLDIKISIFYGNDSSPSFEMPFDNNVSLFDNLFVCYVPHEKIYDRVENEFNAPKIFTIRCRMYGPSESPLEVGQCFIRTRLRVIRTAFIGFVQNFSLITSHEQNTLAIKSAAASIPLFTPVISLAGDSNERICMQIIPYRKDKSKFCICKLFLLDSKEVKNKCTRSEILFDKDRPREWKFPLSFSKRYLRVTKDQFLLNDTLTLKFEIAFTTGIEYDQIEDSEFGSLLTEYRPVFPCAMEELARLYEEGTFCEIKLRTKTATFNVHKNILGARSPVFKTMFTTDMQEKVNDCVDIEDLDADTVGRMLTFLYSDKVDDLNWEHAKCLYKAADKYNIESLKHMCSIFWKDCLRPPNCWEILLLAEEYNDVYLKKIVLEFIAHHPEEVFLSSEWKKFRETYQKLASEAVYSVYL